MQHSLSSLVKTHVIVFFDGSYKTITEADFNSLLGATAEVAIIEGQKYRLSSIQKLLPWAEFAEQYPQKIWEQRQNDVPRYDLPEGVPEEPVMPQHHFRNPNALRGMIKGLKGYIARGGTTGKAEALLETMEKQLKFL